MELDKTEDGTSTGKQMRRLRTYTLSLFIIFPRRWYHTSERQKYEKGYYSWGMILYGNKKSDTNSRQ